MLTRRLAETGAGWLKHLLIIQSHGEADARPLESIWSTEGLQSCNNPALCFSSVLGTPFFLEKQQLLLLLKHGAKQPIVCETVNDTTLCHILTDCNLFAASVQAFKQLASSSEVAAAVAALQSQGCATSVHTSSCGTFQYILSSQYINSPLGGGTAKLTAAGDSNRGPQVVVPISATYSRLDMRLMMRLMEGVADLSRPKISPPNDAAAPSMVAAGADGSTTSGSISLVIASGSDVVQVQLCRGLQPPSESYG